jgi:hypothetical protein
MIKRESRDRFPLAQTTFQRTSPKIILRALHCTALSLLCLPTDISISILLSVLRRTILLVLTNKSMYCSKRAQRSCITTTSSDAVRNSTTSSYCVCLINSQPIEIRCHSLYTAHKARSGYLPFNTHIQISHDSKQTLNRTDTVCSNLAEYDQVRRARFQRSQSSTS